MSGRRIRAGAGPVAPALLVLFGFLLCVVLLFAAAYAVGRARLRAEQTLERQVSATLAPAEKPYGVEAAFAHGWVAARNWADDAQLVQAQAEAPGRDWLRLADAAWAFVYYSPQQQATALLAAAPGRLDLLSTQPAPAPVPVVDVDTLAVDSAAAAGQLMNRGGNLFLQVYPEATLTLTLAAAGDGAQWRGRLLDDQSGNIMQLTIDGRTGESLPEPAGQK